MLGCAGCSSRYGRYVATKPHVEPEQHSFAAARTGMAHAGLLRLQTGPRPLRAKGGCPLRSSWAGLPALVVAASIGLLFAQEHATWRDPSPHEVRFVTVDEGVDLEVLDWGGVGPPIVLLAGLGNTAHIFDDFATSLTDGFRVYGVTRRGYGASSVPVSGYDADRLGDDVLAVLDTLELARPVLVGHSLAGQELSSLGTRYPDRIAGLVYLDAAHRYAYYTEIDEWPPPPAVLLRPPPPTDADLETVQAYRRYLAYYQGQTPPEAEIRQLRYVAADGRVGERRTDPTINDSILAGGRQYVDIRVPALAVFPIPHDLGPWSTGNPAYGSALEDMARFEDAWFGRQASAFEEGVANARVVRLANAHHYVFQSHEADVLQELRAFLAELPPLR